MRTRQSFILSASHRPTERALAPNFVEMVSVPMNQSLLLVLMHWLDDFAGYQSELAFGEAQTEVE